MSPLAGQAATPPPPESRRPDYLSLEELEVIAWEFREFGVSILAAGDEWHLVVPVDGNKQTTYKAHREAAVS